MDLKRVLENEKYYNSLREFEKDLYEVLVSGRDSRVWLELSKNTTLSKEARARAVHMITIDDKFEINLLSPEDLIISKLLK